MSSLITKPKPGTRINPLHPLSSGLVGYWLFNESSGSKAYDISRMGNHGILTNMSVNSQSSGWDGSKCGGSLQYDGNNDYVDAGNDKSLHLTTKATFSFWLKPDNVTGNYFGVIGRTNTPAYNYIIRITNGVLELRAWAGTAATVASDTAIIVIDELQHIVITVDLPNVCFYKNGILVKSTTTTFSSLDNGVAANTNIGLYRYSGGVYFNGIIDLISIYNRAIDKLDVETLYDNQFCNLLTNPIYNYYVAPTGGWTGIINGITNPSHINGVSVANIARVNGVA